MDLGVASKVWTLRSWKNQKNSANQVFEVRFFWLQFFVLESWLLRWLDGFRVNGLICNHMHSAGLLFLKKDQNCKCRNRQLTSTHYVDSLMHNLCITEQAQGKTSWDAALPKTMIFTKMTYKLTEWTNELPQYVSELTSVPSLPIIQGCPNSVDTLTPQLPRALQHTSGRQKIPWKSRPQIPCKVLIHIIIYMNP